MSPLLIIIIGALSLLAIVKIIDTVSKNWDNDETDWPGKYIPIIAIMGQEVDIDGEKDYISLTRYAKDPQKSFNYMKSKEAEVIGVSDHLMQDFPLLLEYARRGVLDLSRVAVRSIALDAALINQTLDALEGFGGDVRTVITP